MAVKVTPLKLHSGLIIKMKHTFNVLFLLLTFTVSSLPYAVASKVIKLSPEAITHHNVDLPLNEYQAWQILALKQVSSRQVPAPYTPRNEEIDGILGMDLNHNQLRDDYERHLLSAYQRAEYVAMGVLAAEKWHTLLQLVDEKASSLSAEQAQVMFNDHIAISQCYYSLQQIDNRLVSPILHYFNTPERLEAKYKAELLLVDIIGDNNRDIGFYIEPCQRFSTFAQQHDAIKFSDTAASFSDF